MTERKFWLAESTSPVAVNSMTACTRERASILLSNSAAFSFSAVMSVATFITPRQRPFASSSGL